MRYFLLLCILSFNQVRGQRVLEVNDKVPDVPMNSIMNYSMTQGHLSDFKGKAILLDFFATWCGSCIASLHRLDSLQDKYKDELQVLVITEESKKFVEALFKKNKKV